MIIEIHDTALQSWLNTINRLSKEFDERFWTSEIFLKKYNLIDEEWEKYVLSFVHPQKREELVPFLKTARLEYESLAKGKYSILYPEVKSVLSELKTIYDKFHEIRWEKTKNG